MIVIVITVGLQMMVQVLGIRGANGATGEAGKLRIPKIFRFIRTQVVVHCSNGDGGRMNRRSFSSGCGFPTVGTHIALDVASTGFSC